MESTLSIAGGNNVMKDLAKLNAWSAKECKVTSEHYMFGWNTYANGVELDVDEWNLEDTHCMQVFREKFGVCTQQDIGLNNWFCHYRLCHKDLIYKYYKTIPEAELACAFAIMNSMEE